MSTALVIFIIAVFLVVDAYVMFRVFSRARSTVASAAPSRRRDVREPQSDHTTPVAVGGATVTGDYLSQQYAAGADEPAWSRGGDWTESVPGEPGSNGFDPGGGAGSYDSGGGFESGGSSDFGGSSDSGGGPDSGGGSDSGGSSSSD